MIAARAIWCVQLDQAPTQRRVCLGRVVLALAIPDVLREARPGFPIHLFEARVLLHSSFQVLAEASVVEGGARYADDGIMLRQTPFDRQRIQRRDQFALRQVAAGAKDDDRSWAGIAPVSIRRRLLHDYSGVKAATLWARPLISLSNESSKDFTPASSRSFVTWLMSMPAPARRSIVWRAPSTSCVIVNAACP